MVESTMMVSIMTSEKFIVSYTAKDVILYALSIGFGKEDNDRDLKYVFEGHPDFATVPCFGLVLTFMANQDGGRQTQIPPFPPPMMREMGVLPKEHLLGDVDSDSFPVIHTWQSIVVASELIAPPTGFVQTVLSGEFVSIVPRSVGTFVTTATNIVQRHQGRLVPACRVQSTALVLGIPSENVKPLNKTSSKSLKRPPKGRQEVVLLEQDLPIAQNTALLYRVASGDSNPIHADAAQVPFVPKDGKARPLLHGLCTLGIVGRILVQMIESRSDLRGCSLYSLEGSFSKPVFVGDVLTIKVCLCTDTEEDIDLFFSARIKETHEIVLKNGRAGIRRRYSRSRL